MKKIGMIIAAIALLLTISAPTSAADPGPLAPVCGGGKFVTVYEDGNYGGSSYTRCASSGSIAALSSIPISGTCNSQWVVLFGHWNNCISSFIVGGSGSTMVCFYKDNNWSGTRFGNSTNINAPSFEAIGLSGWNDHTSSIKFDTTSPYSC